MTFEYIYNTNTEYLRLIYNSFTTVNIIKPSIRLNIVC